MSSFRFQRPYEYDSGGSQSLRVCPIEVVRDSRSSEPARVSPRANRLAPHPGREEIVEALADRDALVLPIKGIERRFSVGKMMGRSKELF